MTQWAEVVFGDTGCLAQLEKELRAALAASPDMPMGQRTLVPDAGEVVLHELKAIGRDRLVMVLRSAGERSRCPICGRASGRIHSRYVRHLSDLPWRPIRGTSKRKRALRICTTKTGTAISGRRDFGIILWSVGQCSDERPCYYRLDLGNGPWHRWRYDQRLELSARSSTGQSDPAMEYGGPKHRRSAGPCAHYQYRSAGSLYLHCGTRRYPSEQTHLFVASGL